MIEVLTVTEEQAAAPEVGGRVRALTTTRTAQVVLIEVTAIEAEHESGWSVWGYRQGGRNAGRRQTMIPRLYFVPRGEQS